MTADHPMRGAQAWRLQHKLRLTLLAGLLSSLAAASVHAQTMPLLDTDDSSLAETAVTAGRVHPLVQLNVFNGDFTRGSYDGDGADLSRVPFQALTVVGFELAHSSAGKPVLWLQAISANGFHSSRSDEPVAPHAWYDNNNLVGIIVEPAKGLRTALTYVIKTTPNGFGSTLHEANASVQFAGDGLIGKIKPAAVVTMHPYGGHGLYTQVGIAPDWHLDGGGGGPTLSFPVKAGIGWSDFYGADTQDASYGSVGVAFVRPVKLGQVKAAIHAQAAALIRERAITRMGMDEAEHSTVVPQVSIGFSVAD